MLGTAGELLILIAFVSTGLSAYAFFRATQAAASPTVLGWRRIGRGAWYGMVAALVAASGVLMHLILTHQYQYAYVYQNSSNDLPLHYLISTFWAGQEGSFMLWGLMMCGVGLALIRLVKPRYETAVMAVVALCHFFMLSMIVGLQLGPLEIGSSPFKTLAEAFPEAPIFQQNPDFIPADGTGLNDLLQNPWMTIHPPMLFAGFSAMIVPFAFAVAALWKRRYTEWVRPALPWTLAAVMLLGVGIAMGGYWAYITLSFGGYWAWDPVENSSLVPWMLGVAAFHTMLVQKKSGKSHKAALFLSILAYLFVVYSTFLTRSGVLGDVSVHSFVDLGLYNQLLIWIVTMGAIGFGLFAYRYRELPTPEEEPRVLSREFMIFSGAMLFCATAAVIILGTSAPILGNIFRDNPSTVPLEFYNTWTLPLALGFTFLIGLGQLFWWNAMGVEEVNRVLLKPIALATACTVAVLIFTPFVEQSVVFPAPPSAETASAGAEAGLLSGLASFWSMYGLGLQMLLLTFMGFFALFGNGLVLWRVGRGNPRMAGGAVTHIGFAVMILGVIASSGFSKALPQVGQPALAGPDQEARENFILVRGQTREINGYRVTYADRTTTDRGRGQYVLEVTDPKGRSYTLAPVAYEGKNGQWFLHPDVKTFVEKDLFAAVTPRAATGVDDEDGPPGGEIQLARGDSTVLGEQQYALAFERFAVLRSAPGMPARSDAVPDEVLAQVPDDAQMAVAAVLHATNLETGERHTLRPIYLVMQDRSVQYVENRVPDWGLKVAFTEMDVNTGQISLAIEGVDVMPEDWVVVQAYEKPFINLVWIGIVLMTGGFVVAVARRAQDLRFDARRRNAGNGEEEKGKG